jgi:hypothetical protein
MAWQFRMNPNAMKGFGAVAMIFKATQDLLQTAWNSARYLMALRINKNKCHFSKRSDGLFHLKNVSNHLAIRGKN